MPAEGSTKLHGSRPNVATLPCIVALVLICGICGGAVAQPQAETNMNIQVENRASTPIQDLYIKKSGTREWGKTVIDGSIAAGGTRHLTVEHSGSCQYDVRVVFQDGRSDEMSDVNLCEGLAVVDKPGEGDTPDKASSGGSSGFSGFGRFINR
jgi:hypothetical protein